MEINEIRPFFVKAMDVMGKIKADTIPEHLARVSQDME
jgi:GINS complex subunit 2